jgi:hypothetical protein
MLVPNSSDEQETAASVFLASAFTDINDWNKNTGNHSIACAAWFVYNQDPQWNTCSIQYLHDGRNTEGPGRDLYDTYRAVCSNNIIFTTPQTTIAPTPVPGTPEPTIKPTPAPTDPDLPCSACILSNRGDILPFYQANGWDISQSNWDNIIANWCGIDPAGCAEQRALCNSCGSTPVPTPLPPPPCAQGGLAPLYLSGNMGGINPGMVITHCIEGGMERKWIVDESRARACFVGIVPQEGYCGPGYDVIPHLWIHTDSNNRVSEGTWITWCSGYATGEEYVWYTDSSGFIATFKYSQYNPNCSAYQR